MLFNKKEIFFSFGGCIEVNAQNWNEDEKQIEKMKNRSFMTQKSHKIILFKIQMTHAHVVSGCVDSQSLKCVLYSINKL